MFPRLNLCFPGYYQTAHHNAKTSSDTNQKNPLQKSKSVDKSIDSSTTHQSKKAKLPSTSISQQPASKEKSQLDAAQEFVFKQVDDNLKTKPAVLIKEYQMDKLKYDELRAILKHYKLHRGNTVIQCMNTLAENNIQWTKRNNYIHVKDVNGKELIVPVAALVKRQSFRSDNLKKSLDRKRIASAIAAIQCNDFRVVDTDSMDLCNNYVQKYGNGSSSSSDNLRLLVLADFPKLQAATKT